MASASAQLVRLINQAFKKRGLQLQSEAAAVGLLSQLACGNLVQCKSVYDIACRFW